MENKNFLTVDEVAERYQTSRYVIYEWITKKHFPVNVVLRLGRKILINRENLERFEQTGGTAQKPVAKVTV